MRRSLTKAGLWLLGQEENNVLGGKFALPNFPANSLANQSKQKAA